MSLPGLHPVDVSQPDARLAARLQTIERRLDAADRAATVSLFVKSSGAVSDADFALPADGLVALEANNGGTSYIAARISGSWKRVAVA